MLRTRYRFPRRLAKRRGELFNRVAEKSRHVIDPEETMRLQIIGAVLCAGLAWNVNRVAAQSDDDFFAGKQISMLLGTTPGGGYDLYGRLVARYLGRHIPGKPTIVAKNMPGAGGLLVANYIYNQAARDGTEIGEPQNGVAFEKLFQTLSPGGRTAHFDATKFGWLGSAAQTVFVIVTWKTAPVRTFAQAQKKQIVLGATSNNSDNYLLAVLSNKIFGTKFKIVTGYDGAAAVDLAVQSGEVQGAAGKDWTTITSTHPNWLRDHDINILLQMGLRPHPDLKGVPFALDLAPNEQDRKVLELIFAKYGMSRPFMAPPGLPAGRLEVLRKAFDATMRDPEFLAEAQKLHAEIRPVTGEDVQALVTRIMGAPPDLAARARAALTP
jgi:tripartite-type tricarboxylate transporter receptor subunit TctC